MRRAALAIVTVLTICAAAPAARAGCADEVRDAQDHLAQVKDAAHRQELKLLLDKAGKDAAAGRERLCLDALVRTQPLYQ